jgi:N-acetyl-anhydromuramyl-L-alanine amidase AmpD
MYETDNYPYIAAKYQLRGRTREVDLIVIHSTESLEVEGGAHATAIYFQDPPRAGSSHYVVDDKETYQCVYDSNTAAGAVGANQNGLHIEQCGRAEQDKAEWDDDYSKAEIERAADIAAQLCLKFNVPPVHLTDTALASGAKGIVGHDAVTRVAKMQGKPNTGHWDPGPNYDWDYFTSCLQASYQRRQAASDSANS